MRAILPLLAALLISNCVPVNAQVINKSAKTDLRTAVIIPFHEDINTISGALLKRKFADAVESDVDVIVLDIKSPGGYTHTTFELMEMVMDADQIEVVAFIEKEAFSGAALLSLACDKIIMLPGAQMGDAGEIVMGPDGAFRYTEAKSRSALAQKVRDTAQANGRPLALAEKMVDKDIIVFEATNKETGDIRYFSNKEWESFKNTDQWTKGKTIREAGENMFFTVNGARAVELGMATETIESRERLAETLNLREPVRIIERTWVDTFVYLLNSGFVTFLLIVIGLIALTMELSAPGLGVGGLVSVLCFSLFFWSRFLGGTSGWLEVTLFIVGLIFIAAELFVIPGFGVAGMGGLALVLGSLVMASRRAMVPENSEQMMSLGYDVLTVMGAFAGFIVAILLLSNYIGDIPGLSRLTLKPPVVYEGAPNQGVDPANQALLPGWQRIEIGDTGSTISPLRPSGKMQVNDFTVDVVTEGDFVDSGSQVRVVGKQGSRVVVRPV